MAEEKIGEVVKFFAKPSVAAVKITDGELETGDTVKITGHTTDFEEKIVKRGIIASLFHGPEGGLGRPLGLAS